MDTLQREHLFDKLEEGLSQIKKEFIDDYNEDYGDLQDQVNELEEKVESLEEKLQEAEYDSQHWEDKASRASRIILELIEDEHGVDVINEKLNEAYNILS